MDKITSAEDAALWKKSENECCEANEKLERQLAVAKALVDRLEEIHQDPTYQAVWQSYANHGGDYSKGPTYVAELAALKEALEWTR